MVLSRDVLARRIKDALQAAGVSQQQLSAAIGMDPTALSKALAGRRGLKSLEVALIAESLNLSTDVLLADDDADVHRGPALAARVQDDASPAVGQAIARAKNMRDLDVLLSDLGRPGSAMASFPSLPTFNDPVRQGELSADVVRRQVGLADDDLPPDPEKFVAWVEKELGVDVCIAPLPNGLDGLALSSGQLRLALVSSGVAATRQRFTLAHEVCHLLFNDAHHLTVDEDVFGRRTIEERRANAFSAAFLMPAGAIRTATDGKVINEDLVIELLGRFRVSLDALAFRLHNVGVVDAPGRDQVRAMSSARIALRPGRTNDLQAHNESRAPGGLLLRAMEAFAAGELGIRPLATLLDTDSGRLLEELTPPRFAPQSQQADESVYAL